MTFQKINRKVHIYVSMFSILFIFLFAFSGFMLNHRWKIWDFWSTRVEKERPVTVQIPKEGSDLQKARAVLKQLGVDGEIHRLVSELGKQSFEIYAQRPGQFIEVKLNAGSGTGTLKTTDMNAWSLVVNMHTMTGAHGKKNWLWTKVWRLMSDLTAIAVLVLRPADFIWGLTSKRSVAGGSSSSRWARQFSS